ncbi:MAG: hypothetical protein SGBAC_008603 [Bacillariaceae sp.]
MANRNQSYVYGQDSIFDVADDPNSNDGIDSMLSRDQRRSTNHYYGQPPRGKGAPGKYHDNNFYNPNKYPILEESNFHNQHISEADYLDQMVHSVERRGRYSAEDYDEEKQHSQLNSSYDNADDDDEEETEDDSKFYLATANATRMRTVDGQNKLATNTNNNNGPNNVLAYILGGFGLCPPDEHGMKTDAQVSHFETNGGGVTQDTKPNTSSAGANAGAFNICAPGQKGLATDTQVQRFAATTEVEETANVPGGVEVKQPLPTPQAKKTPLQQFRERKLKLRQKHQMQEEKKEADLQETASFPFNTRQFSDVKKQQLQLQSDLEQGDVDLEEQLQHQLQLQEEEEELIQHLEEEQRKEQLEKDKKMDAAVDTGMDLCAIPGCPTSSPKRPPTNLAVPPNPPDFPDDPFQDKEHNLFDDGEEQSRLEQIRQKKRTIEHQLEADYSPQNKVQVDTKYITPPIALQKAPMSLQNKAIVSFLVFMFVAAAVLVVVSFFWPDLMPKLGRGVS